MLDVRCPAGHGFTVPPVVYGMPDHEAFEAADRGEIRLGGCMPDVPVAEPCPTCGRPVVVSGLVSGEPEDHVGEGSGGPI